MANVQISKFTGGAYADMKDIIESELKRSASVVPVAEDARVSEIRAQLDKDGEWFVGADKAEECGPHANSGLALIDTGREFDWPIARLCEWDKAKRIAQMHNGDIPYLLDRVAALTEQVEQLKAEKS